MHLLTCAHSDAGIIIRYSEKENDPVEAAADEDNGNSEGNGVRAIPMAPAEPVVTGTHSLSLACSRARMHARTHTRTRTLSLSHACSLSLPLSLSLSSKFYAAYIKSVCDVMHRMCV